jgi:DNA-binding response OmpR family regulator
LKLALKQECDEVLGQTRGVWLAAQRKASGTRLAQPKTGPPGRDAVAKHVLVVDDEPQILEVIAQALTAAGLSVSTARRVSVARDIMARQSVDLVLADARIPGETGLELAAAARALGIAAIIMSGDVEWLAYHGVAPDQYLAKRFDLEILIRLVNERLESYQNSDPRLDPLFHRP